MDAQSDDIIGEAEAAAAMGVAVEQISVLADQGVLTRVEGPAGVWGFARAEVEAARLLGG